MGEERRRLVSMGIALLALGLLVGGVIRRAPFFVVAPTFSTAFVLTGWSALPALALAIWPERQARLLSFASLGLAGGLLVFLGVLNAAFAQGGRLAAERALTQVDSYLLWLLAGCALPHALVGSRWRLAWALLPVSGMVSGVASYLSSGRLWHLMRANGHRGVGMKKISVCADFFAWLVLPVSLGLLLWLARRLRERAGPTEP